MNEEYVNMVLPLDYKNEVIIADVNDRKYKFYYKLDDFFSKIYKYRKNKNTKIIKISFSNFYINDNSKKVIERFELKNEDNRLLNNNIIILNINVNACSDCVDSDEFEIYNEMEQKLIKLGRLMSADTVDLLKKYMDEENVDIDTQNGFIDCIKKATEDLRKQALYEDDDIIDIDEDSSIDKITKNMIDAGYSYDEISRLTGKTIEEIEEIEEE